MKAEVEVLHLSPQPVEFRTPTYGSLFFFDFLFEWYAKINTCSMYLDIEQKPEVGVSISTSGRCG
jgi:hypothetical protein